MSVKKSQNFQLLNACPPQLETGKYKLTVSQEVVNPETDKFQNELEFYVGGSHFTLAPEEIQSIYPADGATGAYGNTFGHITLKNKTLPWKMVKGNNPPVPWMALISIAEDEAVEVKKITVAELLKTSTQQPQIFFPLDKDPGPIETKVDTLCEVVDLPREVYLNIMPREDELGYLAHAKKVNMYDKCDSLIGMDGYFSVVTSNRFIPSDVKEFRKSTLHLVSLEGFEEMLPVHQGEQPLKNYTTVRMISLYSWTVYSKKSDFQGFHDIMEGINTGVVAMNVPGPDILKHGFIPLKHITRTGEPTISLYRGPLSPFLMEKRELSDKNTSDGNIVYDQEKGIFDMSYAAAWQLGRLLTLRNKSVALSIVRWRRSNQHKRLKTKADKVLTEIREEFSPGQTFEEFLLSNLCPTLAKKALIAPVSKEKGV